VHCTLSWGSDRDLPHSQVARGSNLERLLATPARSRYGIPQAEPRLVIIGCPRRPLHRCSSQADRAAGRPSGGCSAARCSADRSLAIVTRAQWGCRQSPPAGVRGPHNAPRDSCLCLAGSRSDSTWLHTGPESLKALWLGLPRHRGSVRRIRRITIRKRPRSDRNRIPTKGVTPV
jgi:hypothetical protein